MNEILKECLELLENESKGEKNALEEFLSKHNLSTPEAAPALRYYAANTDKQLKDALSGYNNLEHFVEYAKARYFLEEYKYVLKNGKTLNGEEKDLETLLEAHIHTERYTGEREAVRLFIVENYNKEGFHEKYYDFEAVREAAALQESKELKEKVPTVQLEWGEVETSKNKTEEQTWSTALLHIIAQKGNLEAWLQEQNADPAIATALKYYIENRDKDVLGSTLERFVSSDAFIQEAEARAVLEELAYIRKNGKNFKGQDLEAFLEEHIPNKIERKALKMHIDAGYMAPQSLVKLKNFEALKEEAKQKRSRAMLLNIKKNNTFKTDLPIYLTWHGITDLKTEQHFIYFIDNRSSLDLKKQLPTSGIPENLAARGELEEVRYTLEKGENLKGATLEKVLISKGFNEKDAEVLKNYYEPNKENKDLNTTFQKHTSVKSFLDYAADYTFLKECIRLLEEDTDPEKPQLRALLAKDITNEVELDALHTYMKNQQELKEKYKTLEQLRQTVKQKRLRGALLQIKWRYDEGQDIEARLQAYAQWQGLDPEKVRSHIESKEELELKKTSFETLREALKATPPSHEELPTAEIIDETFQVVSPISKEQQEQEDPVILGEPVVQAVLELAQVKPEEQKDAVYYFKENARKLNIIIDGDPTANPKYLKHIQARLLIEKLMYGILHNKSYEDIEKLLLENNTVSEVFLKPLKHYIKDKLSSEDERQALLSELKEFRNSDALFLEKHAPLEAILHKLSEVAYYSELDDYIKENPDVAENDKKRLTNYLWAMRRLQKTEELLQVNNLEKLVEKAKQEPLKIIVAVLVDKKAFNDLLKHVNSSQQFRLVGIQNKIKVVNYLWEKMEAGETEDLLKFSRLKKLVEAAKAEEASKDDYRYIENNSYVAKALSLKAKIQGTLPQHFNKLLRQVNNSKQLGLINLNDRYKIAFRLWEMHKAEKENKPLAPGSLNKFFIEVRQESLQAILGELLAKNTLTDMVECIRDADWAIYIERNNKGDIANYLWELKKTEKTEELSKFSTLEGLIRGAKTQEAHKDPDRHYGEIDLSRFGVAQNGNVTSATAQRSKFSSFSINPFNWLPFGRSKNRRQGSGVTVG